VISAGLFSAALAQRRNWVSVGALTAREPT
jgi:hypothetical protein